MLRKPRKWTPAVQARFLEKLAETGCVTWAADAVGLPKWGAYRLRIHDAGFRAAWAEAMDEAYARLEEALLDRALNGRARPVFQGGKQVGEVHSYPDGVAMKLLAHHLARRRDREVAVAAAETVHEDGAQCYDRLKARFEELALRMRGPDDQ